MGGGRGRGSSKSTFEAQVSYAESDSQLGYSKSLSLLAKALSRMRLLTSYKQFKITFIVLFLILCSPASATTTLNHHRRILHQPFFPRESIPPKLPPPSSSPLPQPIQQHQPKLPFSSSSSTPPKPFFPSYHSLPPPPSPTALATFPANISSLLFPQPTSPNHYPITAIAVSVSLFAAALVAALFAFIFYRRHRKFTTDSKATRSDSIRLYPPDTAISDGSHKPHGTSSTSSEFLYLGTVLNSREAIDKTASNSSNVSATIPYQKLGSPELKPLPPLPRYNFRRNSNAENDDEEEFYSPRGSSGRSLRAFELQGDNLANGSLNSRSRAPSSSNSNSASPTNSVSMNSPHTLNLSPTHSLDSIIDLPLPQRPSSLQQPPETNVLVKLPPPPPPPPPPRFWEMPSAEGLQISDQTPKPKLKPLHWDKVRATSDRATVWDQLKASSFQLNEEMIESLFVVNNSNLSGRRQNVRASPTENRVLDRKKFQNIAILLRALNVTIDEVCEALTEGNCDTLGTELLESLLKMAPTEEEECKLKEFKDESPFKLGPAEKFLKVMLDIPFAFKRIDAMLYIANFDSEVEYLNKSFETLEAACEELRNSTMFLKLLEAVLRTGNRMNIGTNRGGAQAFKLDTLVKLVDIKGTDGKTSLLHFVVQEIVRTEGSRISGAHHQNADKIQQPTLHDEVEFRKLGLQVVSGLSGELTNVKKAAAMDSDMLSSEVTKLARGITKVVEVVKLNEETPLKETSRKLSEAMKGFLKKGEEEISRIQAQEKGAYSLVKDITEYFHGNSAKEEAHPFRIFMVVRDFLSILDRVCKDVGKVSERTLVGSRQYPSLANNPILPAIFPDIVGRQQFSSSGSDDEIDSSP